MSLLAAQWEWVMSLLAAQWGSGSCLCLLHSGGVLASASGDGSAKLWRFTEGKCTATLPDHQQPGECPSEGERGMGCGGLQ